MNIKQLRQITEMSQKNFSEKYLIPLKTLQNWEADVNTKAARACPVYVVFLLTQTVIADFPKAKKLIETDIDSSHLTAIKEAKDKIKKSKLSKYTEDVFLYGSTARGEAKSSSDVDILLVLNPKVKDIKWYNDWIIYLKGNISSDDYTAPEIDLHVVFGDSWKKSSDAYFLNIQKEGFSIWN